MSPAVDSGDCKIDTVPEELQYFKIDTVRGRVDELHEASSLRGPQRQPLQEEALLLWPLHPPPSGFVFSPSGGSLEIRAFLEWNISPETQVSPRARSIVTSPRVRGPVKKVLAGWDLSSLKLQYSRLQPLPCEESGEPAGKTLRNVSQVLTCCLEQVLTTSSERQSQEVSSF